MKKNVSVKKRMMFIKGEDYNFLSYNIFIILNGLGCINKNRSLKDHRKLSFLVDFVSNDKLIDIIEHYIKKPDTSVNRLDRDLLNQSYTNSLLRIKTINQLVFTLINENYLFITGRKLDKLDISLNKKNISKDFFKNDLFSIERNNIDRLKKIIGRITIKDITTILESLYYNYEIIDEQVID